MTRQERVRVELAGDPVSVRHARLLVTRTLRTWELPHLEEYATLLVSEVVTNAVLHARTDLALELEVRGDVVRVTVSDGSPRRPERRRNPLDGSTGRGVGLVATLADDWGSNPGQEPWQKDVWFELPLDARRLVQPEDGALFHS